MSYTGTDIFNLAIAIIDELSDAGTVSETQVRDYKNRALPLLNLWQKEKPGIIKTISIARHPLRNLLGEQYDTKEHISEDIIFEGSSTARAAVFFVTDQADIYIEESSGGAWVSVAGFYAMNDAAETAFTGLISVAGTSSPAKYKCRFEAAGDVRIRFSGGYYYLLYNVALFEAAFPSCAKVPEYGEFVKYAMPEDFDNVSEITGEAPEAGLYHKWENEKDLYINYDFEGVIKITYEANPVKLTSLPQTLEADENQATTGAYYLAWHFAMADMNDEMSAMCKDRYTQLKAQFRKPRALSAQTIRDVYGVSGIR